MKLKPMSASEFRNVARRTDHIGTTNELKLLHMILGWLQADATVTDEAGALRRFVADEVSGMKPEGKSEARPTDHRIVAFIQGAKWWEWMKTGATMWATDQSHAFEKAQAMLDTDCLGKSPDGFTPKEEKKETP